MFFPEKLSSLVTKVCEQGQDLTQNDVMLCVIMLNVMAPNLSGAPRYGRLLASPKTIRLGWKSSQGINTLFYYENT
jgi:hypothetical protein